MLTENVRAALTDNASLWTMVCHNAIMVTESLDDYSYRRNFNRMSMTSRGSIAKAESFITAYPVHVEDWDDFLRDASRIISEVRKAEVATRDQRPEDANLVSMGWSSVGPSYDIVPRSVVEKLLQQPLPRKVPPVIWDAVRDHFSFWIRLVGLWFFILPMLFLMFIWGPGFWEDRLFPTIFLSAAAWGLGFPCMAIPSWKRFRHERSAQRTQQTALASPRLPELRFGVHW